MLSADEEYNIRKLQILKNYLNNELICGEKSKKAKHSPTNYYHQFRGFIQTSNSPIPYMYGKCPARVR